MGFYSANALSIESTISVEEANQIIIESLLSVIESYEIDHQEQYLSEAAELIEEGANMNIWKSFRSTKKEVNDHIINAKKAIKKEDKNEAKSELKKAADALGKCRKIIEDNEGDLKSAILGYFANSLLNTAELLIPSLVTNGLYSAYGASAMDITKGAAIRTGILGIASNVSYAILSIKAIILFVKDIKGVIDAYDTRSESDAASLNLFRNKIISYCDKLEKSIDKLADTI